MEIEREAMRKTSVQDFQWDGTEPRIDGKHVWFRSIDGSEHGWPQHTEFEAMRLAIFLHGAIAAALTAERDRHNTIAKNDAEDGIAAGRISHDEARQMLSRFINSHFNNPGEKARASIPARPKYDDDLRMIAYINQQRERDAKFAAFADENGEPLIVTERYEKPGTGKVGLVVVAKDAATKQAAEAAKNQSST